MSQSETADLQKRFDKLIQRERSREAQTRVEEIASGELLLDEKVRRIQEIDNKEFQDSLNEEKLRQKDIDDLIRRNGIVTFEEAGKLRGNIKHLFLRRPYLIYILTDRKRIREFAEKTGLLWTGLLPPNVKPEKIVKSELVNVQKLCASLLPTVISVLKVAWMYLPKLDYNLLVRFRDLCEAVAGTNFESFDYGEPKLVLRFKAIETAFLLCNYKAEYPEIIAGSLANVLIKYPRYADKAQNFSEAVRRILLVQHPRSLSNILVALNMAAYRRYLTLRDLYDKTIAESVPTFGFECDDLVQTRINMHTEELVQKLIALRRTKDEAQRIQNSIGQFVTAADGSYDYGLLKSFYKSSTADDLNFSIDSKNVSAFAQNIFHLYTLYFEEFLTGRISVRDYGQVKAFGGDFCASEFQALKSYSDELAQAYFSCPSFPVEKFVSLKQDPNVKPLHSEEPIYKFILELTTLAVRIGKKRAAVALYRDKNDPGDEDAFVQITTAVLKSHVARIPHWNKVIFSDGFLKDKTFGEALTYTASLSLLIGVFFMDDSLAQLLNKESAINQKIEELYFEMDRLCDAVTFEKIRKKYFPSYDVYFF